MGDGSGFAAPPCSQIRASRVKSCPNDSSFLVFLVDGWPAVVRNQEMPIL